MRRKPSIPQTTLFIHSTIISTTFQKKQKKKSIHFIDNNLNPIGRIILYLNKKRLKSSNICR
jgi:hypothetical protein